MKRNMTIALVLMLLCVAITAQAEVPQISDDLFSCAKKAIVYLSSGEYERLVTLLPFSGDAPSASEWQNFAEGNFSTLGGDVQTDYSVAYWTGSCWKLAVPVTVPDSGSVEALVLTSDDGSSFSGYRYSTWSDVQSGYEASSYVSWSREYVSVSPYIDGD